VGFSLVNFLKGAEAQINPFDHGQTFKSVQPTTAPVAATIPPPATTRPVPASTAKPHQSMFSRVVKAGYNDLVKPTVDTFHHLPGDAEHVGKALAISAESVAKGEHGAALAQSKQRALDEIGKSSYSKYFGKTVQDNNSQDAKKQLEGIVGHGAQNVINVAALIPGAGAVAKVAENPSLAGKVISGLKEGSKFGAGYGAAQGAAQSAANENDFKHVLTNTLVGGAAGAVLGGATGVAAPVIAKGASKVAKEVANLDQRGYIAGPGANRFDKMAKDGKTQGNSFERSDSKLKVNSKATDQLTAGKALQLGQVIKHPELQKDYPNILKEVKVVVNPKVAHPAFDKAEGVIHIPSAKTLTSDAGKAQLTHEIQHAIDHQEGRSAGTTPQAEALKSMTQEQQDAARAVNTLEPQVKNLDKLVRNGNLTRFEYSTHPAVKALKAAQKTLQGVSRGNSQDDMAAYLANEGEQRARTTQGRSDLSQKQIDQNPQRIPVVKPQSTPEGAFAFNKPEKTSTKMEKGEKVRGFTQSVKASDEVSQEAKDLSMTSYTPKKNTELTNNSEKLLKGGVKKASDQVHDVLDTTERGKLSDQQVSDAILVAKTLDEKGDFRQAADVYDKLAEHLTEAGRSVQAASLLSKRTPQGLLYSAQKILKEAYKKKDGSGEIPEKVMTQLKLHIDEIKGTAASSDERTAAVQRMVHFVNDKIPRGKIGTAFGIWRAGLLTGPETVAKIAASHVITTPELALKPLTATVDKAVSAAPKKILNWLNRNNPEYKAGQRTATFNLGEDVKAFGKGFGRGAKAAGQHLKTGEDAPHTGGFESDLGKGEHQTAYERGVYRVHGSVYKPFYSGGYQLEMANQRRIAETMFGGDMAKVDEFLKSPKAIEEATAQAEKFAMQNTTAGGKITQQIQHLKVGPIPVGMWIAPFSRIPAALGTKGIVDYTPVGLARGARSLYDGIKNGKFDQRKFVESVSRSGAGGSAVVLTGAWMMSNGRMTLQEPNDPKEKALWDLQGKTRNSVYVGGNVSNNKDGTHTYNGGKWVTLNAWGPLGIALGIGGAYNQALQNKQDVNQAVAVAVSSGVKLLADQPYMKGITGPANAIAKPVQFASQYVKDSVSSFVPALSQQIARGTDTKQRASAGSVGEAVAQGIPGLRESSPAKTDLYGNDLPGLNPNGTVAGGFNGTVNPFYPGSARNAGDLATQELQRLYNIQGGQGPNVSNPKTIQGTPTSNLSTAQIHDFMAGSGPGIKKALDNLVQNTTYQNLNDDQKTQAINSAISKVRSITFLSPKTGYLPSGPVSGSSADLIKGIGTYAKAFFTDPASAFNDILHGQTIIRTAGGGLIVQRASQKDTGALVNSRGGATQNGTPMQLDHVVPLELGGTNAVSNLSLIPKSADDANNAAENFLGKQLNSGAIKMKNAQQLILDYKNGKLSGADLFAKAGGKGKNNIPDPVTQVGVNNAPVTGKKVTKTQVATAQNLDKLGTGKITVSKAGKASLSSSSTTASTDPKTRYETDLAQYQQDKKSGNLNDIQDMKAQTKLSKERVQSGFSQDVIDFYGMSKAQQEAYFGVNRAKATDLYNKAKVLDQNLVDAGLVTNSKYKKTLNTTGVKTAKSTGRKSKATKGTKHNFAKLVVSGPKLGSAASSSALRSILGHTKIKAKAVHK
jgi:hypothetical protein